MYPGVNSQLISPAPKKQAENYNVRKNVPIMNRKNHFSEEQTVTLEQALGIAVQHHTVGELSKAGTIYEQILQTNPNHTDALHLLGVIAHQVGDNERAVDLIKKAIDLKPNFAEAHSNLGNTLKGLGNLDEDVNSYHKALSIKPDYAEAHNNLGATFRELGQLDDAVTHFNSCLLYTSPSPRDGLLSRMPSSA